MDNKFALPVNITLLNSLNKLQILLSRKCHELSRRMMWPSGRSGVFM